MFVDIPFGVCILFPVSSSVTREPHKLLKTLAPDNHPSVSSGSGALAESFRTLFFSFRIAVESLLLGVWLGLSCFLCL